MQGTSAGPDRRARIRHGSFWLGFALGGFFDGIVLHQVLQWHHLLSGYAPSDTATDLRFQILADGMFHVSHYIFAILGLWLLWSGRAHLGERRAGRAVPAWALIGFGVWHSIDAVVSHWLLGLHRIRMDVDNPLLWDIGWLIPFGLVPLVAGALMLRRGSGGGRGPVIAGCLAAATLIAGPIAALPPAGLQTDGMTLAVFLPGTSYAQIVAAADAVDGRLVWTDASHGVWLIAMGPEARAGTLYRHGALMVSGGAVALGCLSWTAV